MNDLVRALLAAATYASPTSVEQRAFADVVNVMYAAGESDAAVALALNHAIGDGLTHGNWLTPEDVARREDVR